MKILNWNIEWMNHWFSGNRTPQWGSNALDAASGLLPGCTANAVLVRGKGRLADKAFGDVKDPEFCRALSHIKPEAARLLTSSLDMLRQCGEDSG